jgi:glucose-1-phosphate cytidylyltransferase
MKAVILAGGLGTRLSEETTLKPKPMVEIGGMPIIWHIKKGYAAFGVKEFVILGGYKSHVIKEFFRDYLMRLSSVRFNMLDQSMEIIDSETEDWTVTVLDTGESTNTGGRLLRAREHLQGEPFFFTYGDGVSTVDLDALLKQHNYCDVKVTLTAVQPLGRFGALSLPEGELYVREFQEKPVGDGAWINGGFFVVDPVAIDTIANDEVAWEHDPLSTLALKGELGAYRHKGFWQSMDTLRDRMYLEQLWNSGEAPWRIW